MKASVEIEQIAGFEVRISRQDGKPLMLLLRMASRGMGVWDGVWDALAERFSVAQFDLVTPSAADLDRPRHAFKRLAADCAAVADGLGFRRFHLFGWNGGTHVALRCAADYSERVSSCVLLGPFFELTDRRALDAGIEFMRLMLEHADRETYALYWFMNGLTPDFVERHFDQVEAWARARAAGDQFLKVDVERVMKWVRALRGRWLSDAELGAVRTPTLLIVPDQDRWHAGPTIAMARELHRRLPNAHLEVLAGYGSLVPLEAPQRVIATTTPFYERVLGASAGPGAA